MNSDASAPRGILVIDDHPLVRAGVRYVIARESDLVVCAEADGPDAAIEQADLATPDIAVLGLSLGTPTGFEIIRRLRKAQPSVPILALSAHDELLIAEHALRLGARGYLLKPDLTEGLAAAIRQVLAGALALSPSISQKIVERWGAGSSPAAKGLGALSSRQLEIFAHVGRGLDSAAIAERLRVSVKTVETHRSTIRLKLNLKNAADLVRHATLWTERF